MPATGVLDYQRFVVDPGFQEDVWVQAAECRPGNREVVHHILVYILEPGRRDPYDPDGTAATLVGWAPGDMPASYPTDTARQITAGSNCSSRSTIPRTAPSRPTVRRSGSSSPEAAGELGRDEHPGEHVLQDPPASSDQRDR